MDFNLIFQPLVAVLWYLIPFLIIAGIVKTPWFKGKFGEFLVNLSARCFLDKSRYHLIKNVTLPTEDGTTQIDHILVSEFGVFVVETKNMKGWIFGGAKQPFWTQGGPWVRSCVLPLPQSSKMPGSVLMLCPCLAISL